MRRRAYLGGLGSAVLAGCVSSLGIGDSTDEERVDLRPAENWTDEEVATATFDESETPIDAAGESIDSTVEESAGAGTVTAHEFFRDETGRYGVRGRYEGGHAQWLDATFFADSRDVHETRHRMYGVGSDETYEFTIVASEGTAAAIDRYRVTVPDEADSGPGPTTADGLDLLERKWGIIGDADGEEVYGFAATIQNTGEERTNDVYVRIKAYVDEHRVVHTHRGVTSRLEPEEKHTFYSPYLRRDPGSVTEIDVDYGRLQGW